MGKEQNKSNKWLGNWNQWPLSRYYKPFYYVYSTRSWTTPDTSLQLQTWSSWYMTQYRNTIYIIFTGKAKRKRSEATIHTAERDTLYPFLIKCIDFNHFMQQYLESSQGHSTYFIPDRVLILFILLLCRQCLTASSHTIDFKQQQKYRSWTNQCGPIKVYQFSNSLTH